MKHVLIPAALALFGGGLIAQAKVDFERSVLPILKRSCYECHQAPYKDANGRTRKPKGGLRLDGKGWILKGGKEGLVVVPKKPDDSPLLTRVNLPPDDDDVMPAEGDPLSKAQIELIRRWIAEGCDFGSFIGAPGPGDAAIEEARDAADPKDLSTAGIRVLEELGRGIDPPLEEAVKRATGKKCQVVPVIPGSPLLRVAFVSNEATVHDAELQSLAPLAGHITQLVLARTKITDEALASVGRMKRLTRLDLNRTAITDAGLRKIAGLSELRSLNLHGTAVTDEGVQALGTLAHLESVYLWNTKVTDEGVARLQKLLPKTRIQAALDLPEGEPAPANPRNRRRR